MKRPTIEIPLAPVPKPRMTQRDKWSQRPSVTRYYEFKDNLALLVRGQLDARFTVVFIVSMPHSWSEKKKAQYDGQPHQTRPDIDNFIKSFLDALCPDDSYVCDVHAQKIWGREGKIILTERGNP